MGENGLTYDLELVGISLDNKEKDFVSKELIQLDKNIPKNSVVQLLIERKKNSQALHGNLKVSCSQHAIESSQDGANIYQLCRKLSKEINGQTYKFI